MSAPPLEALQPWARQLLDAARVAHLGLVDDDAVPRVLPVTFAVSGGAVWSAVDDKPKRTRELARLRWIGARPAASLTVDRYDDDWSRLAWVQLLGRCSVVGVAGHEDVLDALAARYAPYRAAAPAGPLLRLDLSRAVCWRAAR